MLCNLPEVTELSVDTAEGIDAQADIGPHTHSQPGLVLSTEAEQAGEGRGSGRLPVCTARCIAFQDD